MKRSEIVYVVLSCLALPVLAGLMVLCFWLAGAYDPPPPLVKPVPLVKTPPQVKIKPVVKPVVKPMPPPAPPPSKPTPTIPTYTATALWRNSLSLQGETVQVIGVTRNIRQATWSEYSFDFVSGDLRIGRCLTFIPETMLNDHRYELLGQQTIPNYLRITVIGTVGETPASGVFFLRGERVVKIESSW